MFNLEKKKIKKAPTKGLCLFRMEDLLDQGQQLL